MDTSPSKMAPLSANLTSICTPRSIDSSDKLCYGLQFKGKGGPMKRVKAIVPVPNGSASHSASNGAESRSVADAHKRISSVESLFCYDKPIPEERIEKPVGLSLEEKIIGDHPRCEDCCAKGAVLCSTCSGSGLYVDSIMESQGIIVKVRCLGCGGTGNIMCSECGGRGHLGAI
ncbi:uncharacterized protein LOC115737848 [Rhodamnia argentea]|uniref:Uncharacterized protein LOC115737848 n=1 Tax=Rhodamnia argentea TaxID=178133 RepID=A0A8B8NU69_9MYRT|nr:uncharacterized protein LOC115737848 [Rhodamnia argentea]